MCASRICWRALQLQSWKPWLIILLGKRARRPAARLYAHRYRLYLNRRDVRRQMHLVRQIRGRKFVSGPQGKSIYTLEAVVRDAGQMQSTSRDCWHSRN